VALPGGLPGEELAHFCGHFVILKKGIRIVRRTNPNMEIIISANSKAAAAKAIQKLKEIKGITIKSPVEALSLPEQDMPETKEPGKTTPLIKQIENGLKDVKAAKAGKAKLSPARDLITKK